MKFKVLEIGSGDAFLLEIEDKQILFDSGGSKSKIIDLTKKNKIIDLAICSHNDSDHSNGFIGLLEDPSYEIKEIWLPGIWVPILNFIIEEGINCELFDLHFENIEEIKHNRNYNEELIKYSSLVEESNITIETFDDRLQIISEIEELESFILHRLIYYQRWFNNEFINLKRIIKIAGLAYKKGSLIRWFKPENNNPSIQIPNHGFKPLNSFEICKIDKVASTNFFQLLYLTNENKFSLVFEFYTNENPVIIFSADSDYSFLSRKTYNNNIIVTAPHHGSENNSIVYQKITGNDIIWVRSDRRVKNRPCKEYKKTKTKYCLVCNTNSPKTEICFEFDFQKLSWIYLKGNKCNCK